MDTSDGLKVALAGAARSHADAAIFVEHRGKFELLAARIFELEKSNRELTKEIAELRPMLLELNRSVLELKYFVVSQIKQEKLCTSL